MREERARRLYLAAEAATEAGLVALASEAIAEAERIDPDVRRQAELGYLRGLLLIHAGEDATQVFAAAGRSIAHDDAERAALMLSWASEAAIYRREWSEAHQLAAEASELVQGSGSVAEFWATWMAGVALTMLGRSQPAAVALEQAVAVFRASPAYADDPRLQANFAVALMYLDDFEQGLVVAEHAASAARRQGALPTMLFASSFELVARVVLGDWDRAQAEAGELHAIALDLDNRSEHDDFVWTQAYIAAARGEADRYAALAVLVDPRRDARVAFCGGLLALGRDAPAEAIVALRHHVRPGEPAGYADPDMSPFDLAEAFIRVGEEAEAEALLGAYEPLRGRSWVAAGLARCRALAGREGFEALYAESRDGPRRDRVRLRGRAHRPVSRRDPPQAAPPRRGPRAARAGARRVRAAGRRAVGRAGARRTAGGGRRDRGDRGDRAARR